MTYYDKEFSNLGDLPANMQITNELGQTRWLAVTTEQIQAILEILNKDKGK
jgi:hypothetical protein